MRLATSGYNTESESEVKDVYSTQGTGILELKRLRLPPAHCPPHHLKLSVIAAIHTHYQNLFTMGSGSFETMATTCYKEDHIKMM